MNIRRFHVWFTLGVVLGTFIGSLLYVGNMPEPNNEAHAFVTLGLDPLPTETSSYEVHRATEHFSYIVLGWTIEPAFADEVSEVLADLEFSAQRQEKESMLLTVSGDPDLVYDSAPAGKLLDVIEERIVEYNSATGAKYVIAVERYAFEEGVRSNWRIVAGITLLAFVFTTLILMIFESLYANLTRSDRSPYAS